ncbi:MULTISPECIES: DUF4190 domain-containing protein [Streptomyces]|uniref:DUF4190 domain-containing protein n=1 Tax=Streptomyces changanensis TaxID=2964669 RepID=A0ABY5NAQ3_9ACTN|nr:MULTISPECIES: DUF4190 domain-containing protein [Streptomyces]UUS33080.1 DUF4190 domain-containing protein [Streptomyces changanensis]
MTPTRHQTRPPGDQARSGAPNPIPRRDADGMAVAAFVLGLVGLLVLNILLGPLAIGLALLSLRRGTARRGRAFLGLALGAADLVILAVLTSLNGTVSWSLG